MDGDDPGSPNEFERRRELLEQRRGMRRRRQTPREQGVFKKNDPTPFHDVLVIGPQGAQDDNEFYRVPVVKVPGTSKERPGSYVDNPETLDLYDYSARRTLSIARPQRWGDTTADEPRGPAFGTLPVKREPAATACLTCYLVDAENFTHRNAWTAEEWNDLDDEDLPPAPTADDPRLEAVLAGPRGAVFHLNLDLTSDWTPGDVVPIGDGLGTIEQVDLRHEMEIWNQLRNGLVAGSALRTGGTGKPRVVPLVNITSLTPDEASAAVSKEAAEEKRKAEATRVAATREQSAAAATAAKKGN
jgi:hypothetical protein